MVAFLAICVFGQTTLLIILIFRLRQEIAQKALLIERINELRANEMSWKLQARRDSLTGLGNRIQLVDSFSAAVERANRSGKSFAMLMIDLDNFKSINDSHGHAVGDQVLVTTAARLLGSVRACDAVVRLGGDEFVVTVESFEDKRDLIQIGYKLINLLSAPILLDTGVVVNVGASVGFGLYPNDAGDINTLLHVADRSMYSCKSSGLMGLS